MISFRHLDLIKQDLGDGLPMMRSKDIDMKSAHDAVREMIHLRNAVCHPGTNYMPRQIEKIDGLLFRAQNLAIAFHDYKNATAVRQLGDDLQKEAEDSYQTILSDPPSLGQEWKIHHEQLFHNVLTEQDRYKGVPAVIAEHAKAWVRAKHPSCKAPIRTPGCNAEYWRHVGRNPWDANAMLFERAIRALGAPVHIAGMSNGSMSHVLWQKANGITVSLKFVPPDSPAQGSMIGFSDAFRI